MATWSQADIDKLRAAYLALLAGEAVLSVQYAGPPSRTVTYNQADTKRLEDFLARYDARSSGASGYRVFATSKGL